MKKVSWPHPLSWCSRGLVLYKMRHLGLLLRLLRERRAARVACSKTSRTPSLVLAEHSRYLWAPIFLRISSPCFIR